MSNLINTHISGNPVSSVHQDNKSDRNRVKAASIIGSAIGIAAVAAAVYGIAKKGNPALKFKNISYEEKDALLIGVGSVAGGLAGGLISDKNKDNIKPKLREASQQIVGCMVFPFTFLYAGNRLLKSKNITGMIPKALTTVAALVSGMEIGNKVVNIFNDKIYKEKVKHDVHAEDYFVHTDDICITANMLLKDVPSLSSITSKLLPASFIISGSKTGMASKDS